MMAGCGSEKKTKDAGAASNKVTEKTTETATSDNTAVTSAENAETPKANAETPAENTETTTENSGAGTVSGEFPEGIPTQFEFGSGAGAWGTTIQVERMVRLQDITVILMQEIWAMKILMEQYIIVNSAANLQILLK